MLHHGLVRLALTGLLFASSALAQTEPHGIYTLGTKNATNGVRDLSFVDGYLYRTDWKSLEPAPGVFDFSGIDAALATVEALDQKLSLVAFASSVPDDVLASASATYTHFTFGETVVPWDAGALARYQAMCAALAEHLVPSQAQGGALVPFAKHPALGQLSASLVGLGSFRVIPDTSVLPGYTRELFTAGTFASLHAVRDAFPSKHVYVGIWPIKDAVSTPSLTDHIVANMLAEFDGITHPRIGVFQENLAASKDPVTGAVTGLPLVAGLAAPLLASQAGGSYVMFQALQGWICPFNDPAKNAGAQAADGVEYANATFGSRYVELYTCDVDDAASQPGLQAWHDAFEASVVHQENSGAATLLVNGRVGFAPLQVGASTTLELLGPPGGLAFVGAGTPLEPTGTQLPGLGWLDVAPFQGLTVFAGALDAGGQATLTVGAPLAPLAGIAVQGLVSDTSGSQVTLTARTNLAVQ